MVKFYLNVICHHFFKKVVKMRTVNNILTNMESKHDLKRGFRMPRQNKQKAGRIAKENDQTAETKGKSKADILGISDQRTSFVSLRNLNKHSLPK